MESTCSAKSAMWSQCWVHSKCDQPVIGSHIVVTLGQSFKMGVICNQRAHFGYSGSKNSECAQFLTIAHIVDPLQRTFKMYPIFNCWVHWWSSVVCPHNVLTMCSLGIWVLVPSVCLLQEHFNASFQLLGMTLGARAGLLSQ